MKGHKVAEGKDGISSPNPELCQRQRLAIYQLASLLEHSPRNLGQCGRAGGCENTPFIRRSIYMQITCEQRIPGSVLVCYYHNQCNNKINSATKWLSKNKIGNYVFCFFTSRLINIWTNTIRRCSVQIIYIRFLIETVWSLIFQMNNDQYKALPFP